MHLVRYAHPPAPAFLPVNTPRLHLTDFIPGRKQCPSSKLLADPFLQQLPLEETITAEMLKPLGYHSASIGKWHLGDTPFTPEAQGFDLNIAVTARGATNTYFGPLDLPGLKDSRPEYLTDRLTQEALRFIELNRAHPFFVYLAHFTVHIPLQAKPEVEAKYRAVTNSANPQHNPTYGNSTKCVLSGANGMTSRQAMRLDCKAGCAMAPAG